MQLFAWMKMKIERALHTLTHKQRIETRAKARYSYMGVMIESLITVTHSECLVSFAHFESKRISFHSSIELLLFNTKFNLSKCQLINLKMTFAVYFRSLSIWPTNGCQISHFQWSRFSPIYQIDRFFNTHSKSFLLITFFATS